MSDGAVVNWQNPILSDSLVSDLRKREGTKEKSNLKYRAVKILEKT